jgi:hypothetical protein
LIIPALARRAHRNDAGEIGVDDGVEVGVRHPHEQAVLGDARIGDHDFYRPAELCLGRREGGVDGGGVTDVAGDRVEILGSLARAGHHDHMMAGVAHRHGDGQPDPLDCRRSPGRYVRSYSAFRRVGAARHL